MEHETYLERIKKLKSARKITNEKLAEMTGIPLGTLSKLLAGISDSPKLVNMVAISQALDCSLDYLITGEPENTNNYTLTPAEMTLVETFRALDDYGRSLTTAVIDKEYERTCRQTAEAALRRADEARVTGRSMRALRGTARSASRRATSDPTTDATIIGTAPVSPAAAMSDASAINPAAISARVPAAQAPTAEVLSIETPVAETPTAAILSVPAASAARVDGAATRAAIGRAPAGLGRRRVLLYDLPVSAGTGVFLDDSASTEIFIPDAPRTKEADFALRISGDSMEPKYHSGDVLLVQNCESVEEGELGIFSLDGAGYFKKYGGDRLISLNPAYPPIMLKDFVHAACFGKVVGKLKRK